MFPKRTTKFLASGKGWAGYDETQDEHARGGLLPMAYEEDAAAPPEGSGIPPPEGSNGASMEDDGSAKAMEEDANSGQLDETPWRFATVSRDNPFMLSSNAPMGPAVFWPIQAVPSGLLGLPPQILNAIPLADPALLQNQCTAACLRSVLPGAVCTSPLLAMMSSAAACAAAVKAGRPVSEAVAPTHDRFTTYIQLAVRLHQWKAAVLKCVTPFYESIRPKDVWLADRNYSFQLDLLGQRQDGELEDLYRRGASLETHVHTWERHALEYIHLLERFLYDCLVSRIPGAPPLENVLTPDYWPHMDECSAACKTQAFRDAQTFFQFKYDTSPTYGLATPDLMTQTPPGVAPQPLWRGLFSLPYLSTYREYLRDSEYAPVGTAEGTQ
jgi:hypothetical protein